MNADDAKRLFLTGYPRSGTTLMEKLLHNHPEVCIGSQPFPVLYFWIKDEFLRDKGIRGRRYPLEPQFMEDEYTPEEFTEYLKVNRIQEEDVVECFRKMETYPGHKTPELQKFRQEFGGGTFVELYNRITGYLPIIFDKRQAGYLGAKEALCEEFVPLFLDSGIKVILMIRDPRDVITSMNYGGGKGFTGKPLPTLYVLRMWRKSVAFALRYAGTPGFMYLKYEDLASSPWENLKRVTDLLEIGGYSDEAFADGIRDQMGNVWKGNSSFEERNIVGTGSIGRFRKKLPAEVIRFAETVCMPELKFLNYELSGTGGVYTEDNITGFREQFVNERENFPDDYSSEINNINEEIERYRMLFETSPDESSKRRNFIFKETYDALKRAVRT